MQISKPAQTEQPIHDLLATRWSGRAYDGSRAVARADVIAMMEAARWAPSCYGDQPWRVLVFDRNYNEANWRRALECLVEFNQSWAAPAPVLLAICADSQFHAKEDANRWGQYDTGAAAMALSVQATSLGLMVHQMGGFSADALIETFEIPTRYVPMSMLAVGYQLAEADVPEDQRERELAERARRPLDECFFEGAWEAPLER